MMTNGHIPKYIVRQTRPEEIPHLIEMGRKLHGSSLFKDMDYDVDHTFSICNAALNYPDKFFFNVIAVDDVPVGMLLAAMNVTFFGKDVVANDLLLFIEEEHRHMCGEALQEITRRYKHWATHYNARRIYLATTTGIEPERTREVFEKCGFHQVGTIHEA